MDLKLFIYLFIFIQFTVLPNDSLQLQMQLCFCEELGQFKVKVTPGFSNTITQGFHLCLFFKSQSMLKMTEDDSLLQSSSTLTQKGVNTPTKNCFCRTTFGACLESFFSRFLNFKCFCYMLKT